MLTENSIADILSSQWQSPPPSGITFVDPPGRREFELLLACCRGEPTIARALRPELGWDRVFEQASYHRLLPALHKGLEGRQEVPASIQLALRARYVRHCRRAIRFSAELARILEHFRTEGISVIAQKGPALGHLLYADSAMREFGDLDLLVMPSAVSSAVRALEMLGYEKNLQLSPSQEKAHLRTGYEYAFGRGTERSLVELQWNLLPRFYAVDVKLEEWFARSREHEFDSCRARVLGPEDQLIFLCIHAAKHQWARLGMVQDIALQAGLDLDWDFVVREARRSGTLAILLISLLSARSLLGSKLPGSIMASPEMSGAHKFLPGIVQNLQEMRETPPESIAYFRLMMEVRERKIDRARFVWRLSTTSSVSEWNAVKIPDTLFPLYSLVRGARLTRRLFSFTHRSPS